MHNQVIILRTPDNKCTSSQLLYLWNVEATHAIIQWVNTQNSASGNCDNATYFTPAPVLKLSELETKVREDFTNNHREAPTNLGLPLVESQKDCENFANVYLQLQKLYLNSSSCWM